MAATGRNTLQELLTGGARLQWNRHGVAEPRAVRRQRCDDAAKISDRALQRGLGQIGNLGSGQPASWRSRPWMTRVYIDPVAAAPRGSGRGTVCVMITGSRGLGHQICTTSARWNKPWANTESRCPIAQWLVCRYTPDGRAISPRWRRRPTRTRQPPTADRATRRVR